MSIKTDKELLESAAKVAGVVGEYRTEHMCLNGDWLDVTAIHSDDGFWNPLEDDGDAFRLAVALDMAINIESGFGHTRADGCYEDHGSDAAAATRRAVVRAAADRIESDADTISAERSSRGMFVARLENMQKNRDTWLTAQAVLALLNDCDMLAARERASE
jgi:flagellin-like hook-associated protein FlgL